MTREEAVVEAFEAAYRAEGIRLTMDRVFRQPNEIDRLARRSALLASVEAEREACAKLIESMVTDRDRRRILAAAIRKRGEVQDVGNGGR